MNLNVRHLAPALIAPALIAIALGACSHDSAGVQERKVGGGAAVKAALGSILSGHKAKAAGTAAAPGADALAAAALRSLQGPVIMITFEAAPTAPMIGGMVGQNGMMRSYRTSGKRGFVLRGGLLAATRGFGRDLMSATTGAADQLIRNAKSGTARRVYRYLDGAGLERPLPVTCTIQPAGRLTRAAITATQVAEHCEGSGAKIDNSYLVANGTILASRQYVGPAMGYVSIQQLRN